ncbi:hypothetical protein [Paenibacillus sp. IITD108]|uniref:hypothetical protein n=1 Tax=Paenibacillus sp. IITD108 TaxID=3116649 RepID=UPI002F42F95B
MLGQPGLTSITSPEGWISAISNLQGQCMSGASVKALIQMAGGKALLFGSSSGAILALKAASH